ncbi:unnamed protein product [Boreogadus saida]
MVIPFDTSAATKIEQGVSGQLKEAPCSSPFVRIRDTMTKNKGFQMKLKSVTEPPVGSERRLRTLRKEKKKKKERKTTSEVEEVGGLEDGLTNAPPKSSSESSCLFDVQLDTLDTEEAAASNRCGAYSGHKDSRSRAELVLAML